MNFLPKQYVSKHIDLKKIIIIFINMKMPWFECLYTPNKKINMLKCKIKQNTWNREEEVKTFDLQLKGDQGEVSWGILP